MTPLDHAAEPLCPFPGALLFCRYPSHVCTNAAKWPVSGAFSRCCFFRCCTRRTSFAG